ncbi:fibrinogen-like protein 1 [Ylistrum balloti]|uniref:fibrinogen-like protein 1 n=1 Tax=Ylistrum balloti TaxID=509963 RepID=UPI002905AA76|nr:fibrinogen-like protein 1 [Ylistrum balloti]
MGQLTIFHFVCTLLACYLSTSVTGHDMVSDTCSYTFQVWRPDENIEHKVRYLELEFANMSSFLDKTLLQFRNEIHTEMHLCHKNRTSRGGRRAGSKVKERALNSGFSGFQRELNDMVRRLDHLTTDYASLKNRLSTSPAPQRAGQMGFSSSNQVEHVQTSALENGVNDLKAEWILMKRDLLHLNSENSHIKHAQNRIQKDSMSLNKSINSLGTKLKSLEVELTTGVPSLRGRHNQADSGIQDSSSLRDSHRRMEIDISNLNNGLQNLRTSLKKVKDSMALLRNDNVNLKRMIVDASKGKTLNGGKTNVVELMDRTLGSTPTDCHDLKELGYDVSGVYQIKPRTAIAQDDVYCQFVNNTAYTVLQRRTNGLINFERRWIEYKYGFGNLYDEHWIGNEVIHRLTQQENYILRIDMWDWEGNQAYAEYEGFRLDGQDRDFTLHVGDYRGNAGDSLSYHNGMKFSTEDVDNDLNMRKCAVDCKAGWWFNTCYLSNLNGKYRTGWYSHSQSSFNDGIVWYTLKESDDYSLRKVEMKIKRAT